MLNLIHKIQSTCITLLESNFVESDEDNVADTMKTF